jgi:DNA-binding NarL/FixJ family response regulator
MRRPYHPMSSGTRFDPPPLDGAQTENIPASTSISELPLPAFTLQTVMILGARSVRALWRSWIEAEPDLYVLADAGSNLASLTNRAHQPNVILFSTDGFPAQSETILRYVPRLFPEARLLVVASSTEPFLNSGGSSEQVHGVIQGDASRDLLLRALRVVVSGGTYFLPPART